MSADSRKETGRSVLNSSILAGLLPETRDALNAMGHLKGYRKGQIVVHQDETTSFIGCVSSGILRMQKTLADGRQHIVGMLVEDDLFGRVFDGPLELSIEAATDAEVCAFPRIAFEALLTRSPDLERAVLLSVTNELDRAREWMIILSNNKVAGRIAGFLLLMCTRFGGIDHILTPAPDGIEVKIPISRVDLAHLLGTRPESISRALHSLSDQGDIEILEPDRILILDVEALARAADEDELQTSITLKDLVRTKRLDS